MKELKIVIDESKDLGVESIVLTDMPIVEWISFKDTKETTIEIVDSKKNGVCSPSSKPIK